jgi:hypothetical protein
MPTLAKKPPPLDVTLALMFESPADLGAWCAALRDEGARISRADNELLALALATAADEQPGRPSSAHISPRSASAAATSSSAPSGSPVITSAARTGTATSPTSTNTTSGSGVRAGALGASPSRSQSRSAFVASSPNASRRPHRPALLRDASFADDEVVMNEACARIAALTAGSTGETRSRSTSLSGLGTYDDRLPTRAAAVKETVSVLVETLWLKCTRCSQR